MSEVTIRVNDRDVTTRSGTTILLAVMDAGIPIDTACGGQARCHLCRVTITEGREQLPKANEIEYKALGNVLVAQGMRLACQVEIHGPLSVTVPEPRPKRRRGPPPRPVVRASEHGETREDRTPRGPNREGPHHDDRTAREGSRRRPSRAERERPNRDETPEPHRPREPKREARRAAREPDARQARAADEGAPKKKRRRRRSRRRRNKPEGT